jgi:hypothetical protein
VADLPIALEGALATQLVAALDTEGKIVRALEALGPIADRDVVLLGTAGGVRAADLDAAGARLRVVEDLAAARRLGDGVADVVLAWWSDFRGLANGDLEAVDAILRPGGRLLVIHDYGRDDVSRLRGDLPEYGAWSRRNGPFLRNGFRIRVIHCWWTFESIDAATEFLGAAFGDAGSQLAAELRRPRLSYNVAVYHRNRGGEVRAAATAGPVGAGA